MSTHLSMGDIVFQKAIITPKTITIGSIDFANDSVVYEKSA